MQLEHGHSCHKFVVDHIPALCMHVMKPTPLNPHEFRHTHTHTNGSDVSRPFPSPLHGPPPSSRQIKWRILILIWCFNAQLQSDQYPFTHFKHFSNCTLLPNFMSLSHIYVLALGKDSLFGGGVILNLFALLGRDGSIMLV